MFEIITLVITAICFLLGFLGIWIERRHYANLAAREAKYENILVTDLRFLPPNWHAERPILVTGQVVIANDYLKTFLSRIRKIFGGRMRSYETLLERARWEAMLRMKEMAAHYGANVVWNVRFASSTIQEGNNQNRSAGIEVLAYGTAMLVRDAQQ